MSDGPLTLPPAACGGDCACHLADLRVVPSTDPVRSASSIVFRHQHAGSHEQDRYDAMAWMEAHGGGRCTCDKCKRAWTKGDPSE